MKTITDIKKLKGLKVFLRADFNVQIKNGVVVDDFRIRAAIPTIDFLRKAGAKVVIASHIEVAEGEEATLRPMIPVLNKLGVEVTFVEDYKKVGEVIANTSDGSCILLENLRTWEGEKKNDPAFAKELASSVDIYVNDAFPVSHRPHASVVGIPTYVPGYAGFQVIKEVANLSKAFNPSHPFVFILGGAKFETKLPLIQKFIGTAETVFIGGALANDFYKAKGWEVGKSLLSKGAFDFSPFLNNQKLILPYDVVTDKHETKKGDAVSKDDVILDDGPETIQAISGHIATAQFILWNGTLGLCEKGFGAGSKELAGMIATATKRGATTIVGGGDTVAALEMFGLKDSYTFVSTAGGAMLDFLAQGTLPGLEVLK